MALQPKALDEARRIFQMAPHWVQKFRELLLLGHRLRATLNGIYWEKTFSYEGYTLAHAGNRVRFQVAHPTGIWRSRHHFK